MRTAPEGASAYYINTSTFQGTPFDICLVALSRLAQDKNPAARKRIKADRDILLDALDILRRAAQ